MPNITVVKTWVKEELTSTDINAEFANVYSNAVGMSQAQSISGRKTFTGGIILDELLAIDAAGAGDVKLTEFRWDPASGTATDADGMYIDWVADDDGGNETIYGRQHLELVDTGAASEDSAWHWSVQVAATLTDTFVMSGTALYPAVDDGAALGVADTFEWSDLHLAPGGTISWNNGAELITQTAGVLTVSSATWATAALTCTTFTSNGIDDNATGEILQITDSGATVAGDFAATDLDGIIGSNTAAAGTFTALTSNGIDDNASVLQMTLDDNGVHVGHTAALTAPGGVTPKFQVVGTAAITAGIGNYVFNAGASGVYSAIGKSRGATVGSYTIVENADVVEDRYWLAADGVDMTNGVVRMFVSVDDASPAENAVGGRWNLYTTTTGGTSTFALSVDAGQLVNIPGLTASQDVQTDASKNLTSVSDKRWKNDLGAVGNGLATVRAIDPHYYTWKRDGSGNTADTPAIPDRITGPFDTLEKGTNFKELFGKQPRLAGFFSQDVYDVFPEGSPGGANTDDDGADHWGLNSRALLAALWSAVKELDVQVNP